MQICICRIRVEYSFDEIVIHARTGLNPRKNFILGKGNNRYITIKNIKDNSLVIDDNTDFIDDEAVDMIHKRSQIKKGDILFASIGRFGDTYIIEEEPTGWDINESVFAFTVDEKLIRQKYFHYLFKHKETIRQLTKNSSGSTFKSIKMNQLKKMRFDLPDLNSQDIIVSLLDCVTNIISIYEQELLLLDELVKARFVEMFGNENNPKGWEIVNIEDVANVQVGVVIKPSQYYTDQNNGIKAFRSLNIGNGYIKDDDWVYFSEEGNKKNKKSILSTNDVLVVRSGAPGTACVVTSEYAGSNAIDVIIAHPNFLKVDSHYLCTYTNMPHGKSQIIEGTGGAAQQHFNVGKYNKLKLMLPPLEYQKQYVKFLEEIDKSRLLSNRSLSLIKSITF